ncbi:hypothetical protein L226DRAFT_479367 [Lentinus tigrinus ALCF2SS1-7]|uniref:Uncharacterized protein n=1 Tax=Lentinus tigrinus ALCF2SS1-6 TaxID=1328759 RepID=A0A5C2SRT3_9APHY|nr:hypothetical protein L227DRAFT_149213 [Lentinus tigrinus ALCF2SS1-6]RPD80522.1 hypothetical protein L226DRAFT_479367 [Lentinus tigrinus ALCF2SS1-7]
MERPGLRDRNPRIQFFLGLQLVFAPHLLVALRLVLALSALNFHLQNFLRPWQQEDASIAAALDTKPPTARRQAPLLATTVASKAMFPRTAPQRRRPRPATNVERRVTSRGSVLRTQALRVATSPPSTTTAAAATRVPNATAAARSVTSPARAPKPPAPTTAAATAADTPASVAASSALATLVEVLDTCPATASRVANATTVPASVIFRRTAPNRSVGRATRVDLKAIYLATAPTPRLLPRPMGLDCFVESCITNFFVCVRHIVVLCLRSVYPV